MTEDRHFRTSLTGLEEIILSFHRWFLLFQLTVYETVCSFSSVSFRSLVIWAKSNIAGPAPNAHLTEAPHSPSWKLSHKLNLTSCKTASLHATAEEEEVC